MPAEPTDADRERALRLLQQPIGYPGDIADRVARALADERERARAPFLALARRLDREAPDQEPWDANAQAIYSLIASRIRAAAEEDPK